MLLSFIKTGIRNLTKNKLYSFITIIGLALAVACFTLPFVYVEKNNGIDAFHKQIERIFYVESRLEKSGGGQLWGITPIPLGPALKRDYPQIEESVRVARNWATVAVGDHLFDEFVYFVDGNFLDVFTFPLLAGAPGGLGHSGGVVITERYAKKVFADRDPIGQELILSGGEGFREPFVVRAVVRDPPRLSSLNFDILIPFSRLAQWKGIDLNDWGEWSHTFVRLKNAGDSAALGPQRMEDYVRAQNLAEPSWPMTEVLFEPFRDLSKNTSRVNSDIGIGFPPEAMLGLWMMGIFILLLACANYINIGVVTATRRLREIGIRKVVGGSRGKLVAQFLGEHTLTCLAALLLAAVFTDTVMFPFFNSLFPSELELNFLGSHRLWIFYGMTLLVTVLGSGAYPAVYVSRFQPVEIMGKTAKVGGGSKLMNILLAFQFILTFLLIGTSFIFVQNAIHQKNLDWGYDPEGVISVYLKDGDRYEVYRNAVSQHPDVVSLGGSHHQIGRFWTNSSVEHRGEEFAVSSLTVSTEYLQTLGVRLKMGRFFNSESSGNREEIIVNEKFVRTMGWEQPLARQVTLEEKKSTVIGVVDDFFNQPFREGLTPVLFRTCAEQDFLYLSVRAGPGKEEEVARYLESTWKRLFPSELYAGFHQDQIWDWYYRENRGVYRLSGFLSLMALLISCMGLFGLISITLARRLREISIRKVLGASMMNIVELVNRPIFKILVVVPIIAIPLCYALMDWYLEFCYHGTQTPLTVGPFVYAAVVMAAASAATLASQLFKAARMSIVDNLKEE